MLYPAELRALALHGRETGVVPRPALGCQHGNGIDGLGGRQDGCLRQALTVRCGKALVAGYLPGRLNGSRKAVATGMAAKKQGEQVGRTRRFVLSVLAEDHPGIVAGVSSAVLELGGNIESCSQTVLTGYFTQIMVVTVPESVEPETLRSATMAAARGGATEVVILPMNPAPKPPVPSGSETFVVTIFGEDRPGTIHRLTCYMAEKGINVVDLYGSRQGDTFVLTSEVQVPPQWDIGVLQTELEHMGDELGFRVRMQHEDVFVATNELRLRREHRGGGHGEDI